MEGAWHTATSEVFVNAAIRCAICFSVGLMLSQSLRAQIPAHAVETTPVVASPTDAF